MTVDEAVVSKKLRRKRPGIGGAAVFPRAYRSVDGSANNLANSDWGSAGIEFLRMAPPDYADGVGEPAGWERLSARTISNMCVAQSEPMPNSDRLSDMFWQWGQFLDHDLDLTPEILPKEVLEIPIPTGDPFFDPTSEGDRVMTMGRSFYSMVDGVREQVNAITAFLDGSNIYGSDDERRQALRTLDGTGRLRTSAGDLLPFNTAGLPNAPSPAPGYFLGGDFRANEQVGLTAMHTVWVREHNFWAGEIAATFPQLGGERIFRWAQAIVIGELQAITYNEFLPLLLGDRGLDAYDGYDPNVDAGIANEFATAAFRFGHTMLSPKLRRFDRKGRRVAAGHLPLRDAFFDPSHISEEGIDSVLRGLAFHRAQEIDPRVVDDVRNFLFGAPGAGGFDLSALNIQRGRDHGLASYNDLREAYGLKRLKFLRQVNRDKEVRRALREAFGSVDSIDAWVGGLAEKPVGTAMVGETFAAVLRDQFHRLRAGDRFWYQSYLPPSWVEMVEEQTLAVVIRRNTGIGNELSDDVFHARRPKR